MGGTLIGIAGVYVLGTHGVGLMLVSLAAATLAPSWWYRRRVRLVTVRLPWRDYRHEAATLGFAFMASGILTNRAGYAIRTLVAQSVGMDAAWALGGLYVGFILQPMAGDFYPRRWPTLMRYAIAS